MAAGENTLFAARVAGSTMAVSLSQSDYGQIVAFGKFAKITKGRCSVSSIYLFYIFNKSRCV